MTKEDRKLFHSIQASKHHKFKFTSKSQEFSFTTFSVILDNIRRNIQYVVGGYHEN